MFRWLCLIVLVLGPVGAGFGQEQAKARSGLSVLDALQLPGLSDTAGPAAGDKLELSGEFWITEGTRVGRLAVTATPAAGWYTYSVNQPAGGGQRSSIKVAKSDQFELAGAFQPDQPPQVVQEEFLSAPTEKHAARVVWTAPLKLLGETDPAAIHMQVTFDGQVCKDVCVPISGQVVPVRFAGFETKAPVPSLPLGKAGHTETSASPGPSGSPLPPTVTGPTFRAPLSHATLSGIVSSTGTASSSHQLTLVITAAVEPDWHIYHYQPLDPRRIAKPTLLVLHAPAGWRIGAVEASSSPIAHPTGLTEEPTAYYHEGSVVWRAVVELPPAAGSGPHELHGSIGYQTCTSSNCDPPAAADFRATITLGGGDVPLTLTRATAGYDQVARVAQAQNPAAASSAAESSPAAGAALVLGATPLNVQGNVGQNFYFWQVVVIAFFAGFVLNFMPCVLPVIGLKIFSFVQQAGESRSRIFLLNLWYVAGLMAVFMVLATLAVVSNIGWGGLTYNATFNAILTAVVFAFALSFLGIWEIPVPGFASAGKLDEMSRQEGPFGSFFKGVLTTLLATPCSGPLLVPAVAWSMTKPAVITYLTFFSLGLGMAFPYLVIGAYPKLVAFLPKPGAWMDTFKHVMGFVLLGTVVFLLTWLPETLVIPMITFLFGLWAALWWAGRVPIYESIVRRGRAWLEGALFATAIGLFSYTTVWEAAQRKQGEFLAHELSKRSGTLTTNPVAVPRAKHELPWEPFSLDLLEQRLAERKTIFIDFTAPSCLTCKANEYLVLNTAEVKEFVAANRIATIKADKAFNEAEIDEFMVRLGNTSKAVPFYAIFPALRPHEPIVMDGPLTKSKVIDALKQAGPSAGSAVSLNPLQPNRSPSG